MLTRTTRNGNTEHSRPFKTNVCKRAHVPHLLCASLLASCSPLQLPQCLFECCLHLSTQGQFLLQV
jgi:hypothetical protein